MKRLCTIYTITIMEAVAIISVYCLLNSNWLPLACRCVGFGLPTAFTVCEFIINS